MSETPAQPPSMIPLMSPEKARDIARGLKWLSQSYAEAGMAREASRYERDSQWWVGYAIALSNTKPADEG